MIDGVNAIYYSIPHQNNSAILSKCKLAIKYPEQEVEKSKKDRSHTHVECHQCQRKYFGIMLGIDIELS